MGSAAAVGSWTHLPGQMYTCVLMNIPAAEFMHVFILTDQENLHSTTEDKNFIMFSPLPGIDHIFHFTLSGECDVATHVLLICISLMNNKFNIFSYVFCVI
jgi:hypothetical protein